MKEYKTPVITGVNLGNTEIDGKDCEVVGIVPFVVAAAAAAAAVAKAVETFDDGYLDYQVVGKINKVE